MTLSGFTRAPHDACVTPTTGGMYYSRLVSTASRELGTWLDFRVFFAACGQRRRYGRSTVEVVQNDLPVPDTGFNCVSFDVCVLYTPSTVRPEPSVARRGRGQSAMVCRRRMHATGTPHTETLQYHSSTVCSLVVHYATQRRPTFEPRGVRALHT